MSSRWLLPQRYECLACYLNRMLDHGCNGLKWCTTYRDLRAPRATAMERKFPELGGYCDCEVMANVFGINDGSGRTLPREVAMTAMFRPATRSVWEPSSRANCGSCAAASSGAGEFFARRRRLRRNRSVMSAR